jgi:demethylmenaquinone methyltransferase/2-methoxy-6-polyprenyl-1,4-benzoquinol methylase
MLVEADKKLRAAGPGAYPGMRFQAADALDLPFPESSFDAITIAFGLRNLADRPRFFAEAARVLRPDGSLFVLEFSQPARWMRGPYFLYLRWILPLIGGCLTGERSAYAYLDRSIQAFPDREALAEEIRRGGFSQVRATPLAGGAVALHQARR